MLLFSAIVDFYLFYDGAVDMQIWALLTRSQSRFSDTQVIVKARRYLVLKGFFLPKLLGKTCFIIRNVNLKVGKSCKKLYSNYKKSTM